LESLGLSLGGAVGIDIFVAKCVPEGFFSDLLLLGVRLTCGDSGSATVFGPSMRPPRTRAAMESETTTFAS
jgi:hypothetical protein